MNVYCNFCKTEKKEWHCIFFSWRCNVVLLLRVAHLREKFVFQNGILELRKSFLRDILFYISGRKMEMWNGSQL